jgi:hypothetical protein
MFSKAYRQVVPVVVAGIFLYICMGTRGMSFGEIGVEVRGIPTLRGLPPNTLYVGNRPPLEPSPAIKLPIGTVHAQGWLLKQLQLEADGFTGHLMELSEFLKKEGNAWLSPTGEGHSFWEEVPYWLKGFIDLGYLLRDERIITEAHQWVEAVIASQREDGWFGPRANLTAAHGGATKGRPDLWPNMIMLNVLQSYYEFREDPRVIELMRKYFRWQLNVPDEDFLPPFWQQQRAGDNLASVYWLYNRTGEEWLLDLATKIFRNMAPWHEGIPNWHGVNICQCFRSPGIYWMQSRQAEHLAQVEKNYETVMDLYGQMPGGMFAADENCRPGYDDPRQAAESCSMVEMMLSHEMMLTITGDSIWADRCEEVALNSFPACMTADLKALRYLTAPNMAISDSASKSPGLQNSGPMLRMDPWMHRCCQHNIGHGWPKFVQHLWLAGPGNGLVAAMYAPSSVEAKVGSGQVVRITEETRYPFSEEIAFRCEMAEPASFPLYLRVPKWCPEVELVLNGREVFAGPVRPGFLEIRRKWQSGDRLLLRLTMPLRIQHWEKNKNSVSVYRGPLAFSLKIGEKYVRVGGTDRWPAWEIHPTTAWNYGLVLSQPDPTSGIEIHRQAWPQDDQPFTPDAAPIILRTKAKRIPEWELDEFGLVARLQPSPVWTEEPEEIITLIPMGCARLRISSFPIVASSPEAHRWKRPTAVVWTASHCWRGDTPQAINDGILPRSSADRQIPRFTWWDHRGTTEWVACRFPEPQVVREVAVYWFDDTGFGHCRVPSNWQIEWFDGQQWQPVKALGPYGVDRDRFNRVPFEPVKTTSLRLVVQLQENFSAGILECQIQ